MAASKNNQFWKLRSKHGRDILFSSPEFLWSAACEYFDWCDENPWYLYIEGKIRYRQYETKQGEKRYVTEIHAIRLSSSLSAVNERIINARILPVNRHNLSHPKKTYHSKNTRGNVRTTRPSPLHTIIVQIYYLLLN
ncbi:hypothetical protein [Parabacteroides goldsteinii]|uniref:hypothetical protein n=1 Tax=Parabacteroides goldsteinii TaxID=328812 RepID=UPI003219D8EF